MKKVLVTGLCGFIGRSVAQNLAHRGIDVIGIDRHPKPVPGASYIKKGDLRDPDLHDFLWDEIGHVDGVIHLAGVLGTSELLGAAKEAVEANILAAVDVMEACQHHGTPMVQIATGNATWSSVYPITKECAVRLAQAYAADAGLKVAVVRAMNAYGPYQKHAPIRKYIPNIIRWAMRSEPVEIYGNGQQVMDPIWVGDVAEILVRALLKAGHPEVSTHHVYEAGTGVGLTANQVADLTWEAVTGQAVAPKVYLPMRAGEPEHSVTVADTTTLYHLLTPEEHVFPLRAFEDGIAETVRWYIEHPDILEVSSDVEQTALRE